MALSINNQPLEDALLALGAGQPIPSRSKVSIATGLLWAAVRNFDPRLVPDGVLPARPSVGVQDNGSPARVNPANQPNPAPREHVHIKLPNLPATPLVDKNLQSNV